MSEWKEYKYTELATIIGGGTPKTTVKEYWNGCIPWLSVKDFGNDNKYVYTTEKSITELGLNNSSTKMLKHEDIIISARGTVGELAMIPYPMSFNQSCFGIRAKEQVDPHFLYYLTKTKIRELKNSSHGSVFDTITRATFENISCNVPPITEQKRIASILSSLDDKISVNKKICENLEAQAQALFKHWFIDFAPFKNGKFVESELGMIPEGWRVGTLGEIADITMGQSPSGSSYNENGNGVVFYQGRAEFGYRFPKVRLFTTEPKRFAEPLSTLLSVRAPVGDINVATEKCCIGRGLAAIKSKSYHSSYILYLLKSLRRRFDVYNGEGTVFGSINKDTLNGLNIVIPPNSAIREFNDIVQVSDSEILESHNEDIRLQALRDTLLPRLMSGQIKL